VAQVAGAWRPGSRASGPIAWQDAHVIARRNRCLLAAMTLTLTALIGGAGRASPAGLAPGTPPHGTLRMFRIAAPSLGENDHSVRVYLPPSYFDPDSSAKRYPVVFLLHGWPGGDGNWSGQGHADETLDTLIDEHRIPELIAVIPSGNGHGMLGRSLYVNATDGGSNMADFISRDLIGWADSTMRTIRDRRARGIIGLSDGGTGALNLTFRHPDLFSRCAGHSGDYHLHLAWDNRRIFGDGESAQRLLAEYSPVLYAARIAPALHTLTIYFDVGAKDSELESNRELDRELTRLEIPHTYREYSGGHNWSFWRGHLDESLVALWGKDAPSPDPPGATGVRRR
jgi:enterochelin esterase-like enzyme